MKLTIKNYKEATKNVDFKKLPEAAQEAHKEFDSFADFYKDDKDIKDMLDNHFKIVEPFVNNSSKESNTKTQKAKSTPKKSSAKTPAKKKAATPKRTPKKTKRKPIEVPLMPLEIKIIKRYINMHGKKVTELKVSLLYKAIQKAATEKTIRKTSKYAEEIRKILSGAEGPRAEMALANAGAALYVAEKAASIQDGVGLAREVVNDGRALEKLDALVACSNGE